MMRLRSLCVVLATGVLSATSVGLAAEPTPVRQSVGDANPGRLLLNTAFGAGAIEFYDDSQAVALPTLTFQPGVRFRTFRLGASLRYSNPLGKGFLIETGPYASFDLFSVRLDNLRTIGLYAKGEFNFRFAIDRGQDWSFVPSLFLGLRALGIYAEAGMGPVIGPFNVPNIWGVALEGRLGIEFCEFLSLWSKSCFQHRMGYLPPH